MPTVQQSAELILWQQPTTSYITHVKYMYYASWARACTMEVSLHDCSTHRQAWASFFWGTASWIACSLWAVSSWKLTAWMVWITRQAMPSCVQNCASWHSATLRFTFSDCVATAPLQWPICMAQSVCRLLAGVAHGLSTQARLAWDENTRCGMCTR